MWEDIVDLYFVYESLVWLLRVFSLLKIFLITTFLKKN